MTDRARHTLGEPPHASRDGFAAYTLKADDALFRFHRRHRGPWWFCSCGDHRFDLAKPLGTCYLGRDELTAVLEVLGPEVRNQLVSRSFMDERQLRKLALPRIFPVADTLDRKASRFGVTREIGTMTPYDLPQRWARWFNTAGHKGIRYGPRHDVAPEAWAVAIFGRAGERTSWRKGRVVPTDEIERLLSDECGIEVAPVPTSSQVTVLEDD